jgi:hypothetical protein
MSLLTAEVMGFSDELLDLPEGALRRDWSGRPGEGYWHDYSDNLSDIVFLVYQQLRAFAVAIETKRALDGPKMSEAQRILAQHHLAYRDFHGVMAGVTDEELDLTPFERKWSLRSNLAHVMVAECGSQGPQLLHALNRRRSGKEPAPMPVRDDLSETSLPADYGSLAELLCRFDSCHHHLIESIADISDAELDALSIYWEDEPVDLRFRLYRFAWHLRSHIMQADKIRIGIGHHITDTDRLVRLLYNALGEAEGALIGAGIGHQELERNLATSIKLRAQEVSALAQSARIP